MEDVVDELQTLRDGGTMQILTIRDKHEPDTVYYRVPLTDPEELQQLVELAEEKGLETNVRRADTFDMARTFLEQLAT
jgi:hypothetical protein